MAKAKAKVKLQHLTVLLLGQHIKKPEDAISAKHKPEVFSFKNSIPFSGSFHLLKPKKNPLPWLKFVQPGLSDELPKLTSASASAVLFVSTQNAKFAITFGHGRTLLKTDSYVRDFGLKVVLNSVNPKNIRSVDAKAVHEMTLLTRRQASQASSLDVFGLNVSQDVLRGVIGTPTDANLANLVGGSDSLSLNTRVQFNDLGDKCDELWSLYQAKTYQKHFKFIDDMKTVRDPQVVAQLDAELLKHLNSKNHDRCHLAPSDIIDWEEVDCFAYSDSDVERHDLDIEEFLSTIADLKSLTVSDLKKIHPVKVRMAGSAVFHDRWSVYECIAFECELNSRWYVLSSGQWYEIAKTLSDRVDKSLAAFQKSPFVLPPAKSDESEGRYNTRVAKALKFGCLDQKLVRVKGTVTDVEPCDLFGDSGQLIHVKRKTRSSTLSHLFAQGTIAADAFLTDDDFRQQMRYYLSAKHPPLAAKVPKTRPDPTKHEVIYAILAKQPKTTWPHCLPFFSKLNFMHASDRIQSLGFPVSLIHVVQN